MLLLHKYYLYCDYICYVVLHFSTEKYKLFLRSPIFKDISQLTPVIFYLTYCDSHDSFLVPVTAADIKYDVGVGETFVMMQQCCLGYTSKEHEQKERIIRALRDRALLSSVRALRNWRTMTALFLFIKTLRQKLLTKAFSRLRDGLGRQAQRSVFCDTLRVILRRRRLSLAFKALYKNMLCRRKIYTKQVNHFKLTAFFHFWKKRTHVVMDAKREERLQRFIRHKHTIQVYRLIQSWKKLLRIRKVLKAILHSVTFCAYVQRLRRARLRADVADFTARSTLNSSARPFKPSVFSS